MSDTLEIFGQEWTGVTGFKATDDNDLIKTFIRPQGAVSITANGTGIDVSQYASADVAVPETNFVVTVSWNSTTQRWEPNKTFSEIQTAYNAGKTIAVVSSEQSGDSAVDGEYHTGTNPYFEYWVRKYMDGYSPQTIRETGYHLTSTGINTEDDINYIRPTGNLAITQNGNNIDVANYSTVSVNVSGSSKNAQAVTSTTRVTSTSLTACSGTITVAKTGTYDVYWSTHRTSTSGSWSSRLYVNNTASGTEQTSGWSNHVQPIHLTNVSLTAGQTIRVYAKSRDSNYYAYVPLLAIIES